MSLLCWMGSFGYAPTFSSVRSFQTAFFVGDWANRRSLCHASYGVMSPINFHPRTVYVPARLILHARGEGHTMHGTASGTMSWAISMPSELEGIGHRESDL